MYYILMPVAGDPATVRAQVDHVSGLPGAPSSVEVTVVHIVPEVDAGEMDGRVDLKEYVDRPESVETAVDGLEAAGIDHESVLESGSTTDEILAIAADRSPDVIVTGARDRSPVGKAILGSVSQELALEADCPVTIVRSSETE
jgi:nucleotide-binding universal stress UspA family protein